MDRVVNLLDDGADVAVRIGHLASSSLTATRVGTVRRVVCAAPDYLERMGSPLEPGELRGHKIIGSVPSPDWRFGTSRKVVMRLRPRLVCNTVDAALAAALQGHGLARLLSYQVAPAVADGRLQIVLAEHEEEPTPIHIVSADGRRAPAKVRAFIDLAVERLRSDPMLA